MQVIFINHCMYINYVSISHFGGHCYMEDDNEQLKLELLHKRKKASLCP